MAIPHSSALTAPGTSTLSLQVSSVDDLARLARVFAASGLFGRAGNQETQVAECAIRLMAGMEAGFSPFASATGIHIINGKPAFSANLLAQALRPGDVVIRQGRPLHAGLCVGSSDLIGYRQVDGVAQFVALEVKSATGRPTAQQVQFLDHITSVGGCAGIVRSVEDARTVLGDST